MAELVIDGVAVERRTTGEQETGRKRMLARTVPRLVSRHLAAPPGWRRFPLMARLPLLMPRYRRRFARAEDDSGLREVKQTFVLVSGIRTAAGDYRFEIVRCRFHEAFRDMGAPAITEAFCRSDEAVFNEVAPHEMRFHRVDDPRNTIARGAHACVFVFERIPARRRP